MYERWGKRALDVVGAGVCLVALSPLLAIGAAAVLIDDGRPVLFRQLRVGRHGVPFRILKFRSMRRTDGREASFDAGDGSRVTCSGRWLRATKLDELPQLVNVMRGEMSLVGPRPEVPSWVDSDPQRWARVLAVRPGVTDRASVVYRHEERELAASGDPATHYREVILPRKLALYEAYVADVSMVRDARILAATAAGLFKRA